MAGEFKITTSWRGVDEVIAKLGKLPLIEPQALGAALYTRAELIMTEIKQGPVPVDVGTLRDSGYVERPVITPPSGASVTMGFGGAAAAYAHYQHEGINRFTGEPLRYQRPGAHAHFLTGTVADHIKDIRADVHAAALKAAEDI